MKLNPAAINSFFLEVETVPSTFKNHPNWKLADGSIVGEFPAELILDGVIFRLGPFDVANKSCEEKQKRTICYTRCKG